MQSVIASARLLVCESHARAHIDTRAVVLSSPLRGTPALQPRTPAPLCRVFVVIVSSPKGPPFLCQHFNNTRLVLRLVLTFACVGVCVGPGGLSEMGTLVDKRSEWHALGWRSRPLQASLQSL
jgi:hypothetical protein